MDELARQVAMLQADNAWIKTMLWFLLSTVVGWGGINTVALLVFWRRNNNKKGP
jgi:hypothetical protein